MINAINARAAEAKETMTMVMAACKVGIVAILKAIFMPKRGSKGEKERGGGGCSSLLRAEASAGIITLVGRAIF